ncbi:hypothetical protein TWF730_007768 [Orbilia blumenaviensis]|uniref:Cupin 2 conserved barrel domain-containing protein n=1 Tax=Orbilia blumenaviensis TaxID=1796055 RepID=A0AAV9VFB1_9PEZI
MSKEALVKSWGYRCVFTWTDGPNEYYPPHRHATATTHLIVSGSLTIRYPQHESDPRKKTTHGVGERVDVGQNVLHEVWIGDDGCTCKTTR